MRRKARRRIMPSSGTSKTEFALRMFPNRSESYARRRLYETIMGNPRVVRHMIELGWRPFGKYLTRYQEHYLEEVFHVGQPTAKETACKCQGHREQLPTELQVVKKNAECKK